MSCQILSSCWSPPGHEIFVLPLRTPTLPPATHTNTSFVGSQSVWVVDPATPYDGERGTLIQAIEARKAAGAEVAGIVLTHHHPDHIGAAEWLRAQLGVPILAHTQTAALLDGILAIDRCLVEGEVLFGGPGASEAWEVLHTPGHASGHIVLWNAVLRGMVAGDMVAGVGTILIETPDGDMQTYLEQLSRLRDLVPAWLVPAHGDVSTTPVELLEGTRLHRLAREAKLVGKLTRRVQSLRAVTTLTYDDIPAAVHPLAERSTLAHLKKLESEGRAIHQSEGWRIGPEAGPTPTPTGG